MRRNIVLALLLLVAACGPKPAPIITGPVPTKSDWPFSSPDKVKLENANDNKTDANGYVDYGPKFIEFETAPNNTPTKYREFFAKIDSLEEHISEGEIWFKNFENSNQFGFAMRETTYESGKKAVAAKDQIVIYGIGFKNSLSIGKNTIVLKYGYCPNMPNPAHNPNDPNDKTPSEIPKFNCSAKSADLLWQKLKDNPEMLGGTRKYEIIENN